MVRLEPRSPLDDVGNLHDFTAIFVNSTHVRNSFVSVTYRR
jgi:hypothetical protein